MTYLSLFLASTCTAHSISQSYFVATEAVEANSQLCSRSDLSPQVSVEQPQSNSRIDETQLSC